MSTGNLLALGLKVLGISTDIVPIKLIEPKNTWVIVTTGIVLFIYWIILLIIYEKDKFEVREYIDESYLFNKYNPLLAGCIVDSRNVLSRDIISIILNLMHKGIVGYEITKDINTKGSKENYKFEIYRVREKELEMDKIEAFVHMWLFEWRTGENEKIDLTSRLKEMSGEKGSYKKLEKLNYIVINKLNEMGLNKNKVPFKIKLYNVIILLFCLIMSAIHVKSMIIFNPNLIAMILFIAMIFALLLIIPLVAFISQLLFQTLAYSRRTINIFNEKLTGQRIVSTSVSTVLVTLLAIILTYLFSNNIYLVLNELLIGIATLIVLTDNLMLKNDRELINEYSNLIILKERLEEYTMLSEKDIQYIELWDKYIIYATSFGITLPIIKKAKKMYQQDNAMEIFNNYDFLYYLSKSYMEVFWDFEFKDKTKKEIF